MPTKFKEPHYFHGRLRADRLDRGDGHPIFLESERLYSDLPISHLTLSHISLYTSSKLITSDKIIGHYDGRGYVDWYYDKMKIKDNENLF